MLFKGCLGSNKLIHRLIGWNQVSWLSNQVIGRYYQPSVVLHGVILGLVKSNHIQLTCLRMYLLIVFISPALGVSLGYCKLILMSCI